MGKQGTTGGSIMVDIVKAIKKASRELHKGMPSGGRHGTKKGKKGYSRHPKHKGQNDVN